MTTPRSITDLDRAAISCKQQYTLRELEGIEKFLGEPSPSFLLHLMYTSSCPIQHRTLSSFCVSVCTPATGRPQRVTEPPGAGPSSYSTAKRLKKITTQIDQLKANKYQGFVQTYTGIKDGNSMSPSPSGPAAKRILKWHFTDRLPLPPTANPHPCPSSAGESSLASKMPEHKHLNRYNNIVAYDSSRVKVNANKVSAPSCPGRVIKADAHLRTFRLPC